MKKIILAAMAMMTIAGAAAATVSQPYFLEIVKQLENKEVSVVISPYTFDECLIAMVEASGQLSNEGYTIKSMTTEPNGSADASIIMENNDDFVHINCWE